MQSNTLLTHKGLTLNLLRATISHNGNEKELTKNELGILRLLMLNKGNIIPRDAIIDELFLIVYGSYFIATYLSCKRMVTEQKEMEV